MILQTLAIIIGALFLVVVLYENTKSIASTLDTIGDTCIDDYMDDDTEGYINRPGGYQH